jgi:hypothetical protein
MIVMSKLYTARLEGGFLLRMHHFRRSFRQVELVYMRLEFCRWKCDPGFVWWLRMVNLLFYSRLLCFLSRLCSRCRRSSLSSRADLTGGNEAAEIRGFWGQQKPVPDWFSGSKTLCERHFVGIALAVGRIEATAPSWTS